MRHHTFTDVPYQHFWYKINTAWCTIEVFTETWNQNRGLFKYITQMWNVTFFSVVTWLHRPQEWQNKQWYWMTMTTMMSYTGSDVCQKYGWHWYFLSSIHLLCLNDSSVSPVASIRVFVVFRTPGTPVEGQCRLPSLWDEHGYSERRVEDQRGLASLHHIPRFLQRSETKE